MNKPINIKKSFAGFSFKGFILLFCLVIVQAVAMARTISPFPHTLANIRNFRSNNQTSYYFYVTGDTSGSLYGTGIYTDDSSVAKAAVHAGILSDGQKGVVKVTVLPGQSSYTSSTAHGITSTSYSSWPGSFQIASDDGGDNVIIDAPDSLFNFRDYPGEVYLFSLTANKAAGTIWGTNVYTDDSNLKASAVHAGVLGNGESGVVRVVIVPGQSQYLGSTQNTVNSVSYGKFASSYAISNRAGTTPLLLLPGSPENPLNNPGNLSAYGSYLGGAFYFQVTGANSGSIWGTQIYTADSALATASVHSGVLALGQTGTVKVTILPGQSSYNASSAHGFSSNAYGPYSLSYSITAPDGGQGSIPVITSPDSASYVIGEAFNYQITVREGSPSFNATGLPKGLSINQTTGLISGTPQLNGHFLVDIQAGNSAGTRSQTLILDSAGGVQPPVIIAPPANSSAADCLFNWAESHIPELFNPSNQNTGQAFGYVYRYYSGTNTYLGVFQGTRIHLLQLNKSQEIVDVGSVEQYKPLTGC